MNKELTLGFIGNPNCGKTTLFNAYTGANLKVANWPGVTVEKVEGAIKQHGTTIHLVDLPGTYSLTSYTMEEQVSRNFILSDNVDVLVNVVDASSLERNLYLTLQLLELGKPVVVALNMIDIVEKRGMEIDLHRLPEILGVPVIPVSARKRTGIQSLMHAALHHKDIKTTDSHKPLDIYQEAYKEHAMVYSNEIEDKIRIISLELKRIYPKVKNTRWYAIKLLEQDKEITEKYPLELKFLVDRSYETDIINQKYAFIEDVIHEVVLGKSRKEATTDKADKILTNTLLGIPIFLVTMALVFFLTFTIGDWLKGYVEILISWFSDIITSLLVNTGASGLVVSLVVDGVIAGVGGILTFLPNIFILFLALAFLEDSGYMARVAYIMDDIMGRLGLSGKAFIPMILGFGCTVPAIMASRSLESKADRFKVMLVTPFMSCSARLPIYILFSDIFFNKHAMFVAYSMYIIGIIIAFIVALIFKVIKKGETQNHLLIELPDYKTPSARTIFIYVWDKVKDFITRAGTTIFIASVVIWFLLNFNITGLSNDVSQSFAVSLGKWLVPVLKPVGLGYWQIVVALIAGITAKEVVVSSTAVLFGIQNINSPLGEIQLQEALTSMGFGALNAYCLMLFCLLYVPCIAALITIKRESRSTRWMLFCAAFQIFVAWSVCFVVFQIGSLFI